MRQQDVFIIVYYAIVAADKNTCSPIIFLGSSCLLSPVLAPTSMTVYTDNTGHKGPYCRSSHKPRPYFRSPFFAPVGWISFLFATKWTMIRVYDRGTYLPFNMRFGALRGAFCQRTMTHQFTNSAGTKMLAVTRPGLLYGRCGTWSLR